MATLAELRSRVSAKIGLDNTAAGVDQVLMDGWINEGVTDVLLRTHCKVTKTTITLVAGTNEYTLDSAVLAILSLSSTQGSYNTTPTRISVEEVLELRRGGSTGGVDFYALAGANLLMVYPTPASAGTITVYGVPRPTTLSAATASPDEVPLEFQKGIELYALGEAADYDDDETSAQGSRYREEYEKWIRWIRTGMNKKGGDSLPNFRVGRTPQMINTPSQDI